MGSVIKLFAFILLICGKKLTADETLITIAVANQKSSNYDAVLMTIKQAISDFEKATGKVKVNLQVVDDVPDVCNSSNSTNADILIDYTNVITMSQKARVTKMLLTKYCAGRFYQNIIDGNGCLKIKPPGDAMVSVIRFIVSQFKLSSVSIIYDDTFEELSSKYATLLTNLPTRQIITPIRQSNIEKQLKQLKLVDISNFFIAANLKNMDATLHTAAKLGMNNRKYAWFLLTKDFDTSELEHAISTALLINPVKPTVTIAQPDDKEHPIPIVDHIFIYNVAKFGLHEIYHMKTALCANLKGNESTQLPNKGSNNFLNFKVDEDAIYDDIQLDINVVNNTAKISSKQIQAGIWSKSQDRLPTFNNISVIDLLPIKRYTIVTAHQPPFVYRIEQPDGKVTYEGYCIDLINELRNILNFTYEIYDLYKKNENESSNPQLLLGEIRNRAADIVLAALFSGAEDNGVEFTIPFYDLIGMKMLLRKPAPESSLFRFLTVMEPYVWCTICVAYVVTSILLWIIDRFSPFSYQNNQQSETDEHEKRIFTLKESFWFCVTSLTPQGSGDAPRSVSGRLLAATWWLFGFVFIASYTANLAAFLTVARLDNVIDSLDSLANQYLVKYSAVKDSTTMKYFEKMANIEEDFFGKWKEMTLGNINELEKEKYSVWNYPVGNKYTKMWKYMSDVGFPLTMQEGIEKMRRMFFILIADSTEIVNALSTNCDLTTAGEEFSRRPIGLAVSKGSVLKEQLSMGILKLQNARILEVIKEKWWNNNPYQVQCPDDDKYTEGISLKNIGGIFLVIFAGIALAWIILLFEFIWYNSISKRIFKKRPDVSQATNTSVIPIKPTENQSTLRNRNYQENNSLEKSYFYTVRTTCASQK